MNHGRVLGTISMDMILDMGHVSEPRDRGKVSFVLMIIQPLYELVLVGPPHHPSKGTDGGGGVDMALEVAEALSPN